ncbi:ATP-binding protein [Nannocystis pusilla]|uniref:histidine kinase n=1 Tax=Nannocystis pusilla TaxID=889268 RepID=A0A9X3F267_9BACT|nr:ATP-binding protein [Nannocystis pusilla]MCY1010083.1 ATP-binding protein [Nannocystis pusilla]
MQPAHVLAAAATAGESSVRRKSRFTTLPPQVLDFALSLASQGRAIVLVSVVLAAVVVVAADHSPAAVLGCSAFVLVQAVSFFNPVSFDRARTRTRDLVRYAALACLLVVLPGLLAPDAPVMLLGLAAACAAPLSFAPRLAGACVAGLSLACALGVLVAGGPTSQALIAALTVSAAGVPLTLVLAHHGRSGEILRTALGRLEREMENRQQIEDQLRRTHDELERRVEERTIALTRANRKMESEIRVRRQAEEQALEANRIKSSFLANMSHELRTPLNAIIGYSEILLEDTARPDLHELHEDLGKIHGSAEHLLALISDILDLSKIESGKMDINIEAFQLGDVLGSVMSHLAPLAERNGDTLKLRCARDLGELKTDRTKLHQILSNLLSNACKFTHNGRIELSIRIQAEGGRSWYRFEVSDTGIGIAPDVLERLFAPFVQADSSTTRKFGGTGLGLAISRHYARMLGGDITVRSQPGVGSVFTLRLPQEAVDPRKAGVILVSHF